MALTPEQLAAAGTEHGHQRALIAQCKLHKRHVPQLDYIFAIPNGGDRDKITAGKLKNEGVKAGVPDLFLPVAMRGYHGLFLEMKIPERRNEPEGGLSDAQVKYKIRLEAEGYAVIVCYGWEHAWRVICGYMSYTPA